jgi:hypothetical protein
LPKTHSQQWRQELFANQAVAGHSGLMSKLYRTQLRMRGKPIAKKYPRHDPYPTPAQLQAQFQLELTQYEAPAWAQQLCWSADAQYIAAVRQMRARQWLLKVDELPSCRAVFPEVPKYAAPYVFPVWLNNPQPVFEALRGAGVPVFRWDWRWPGAPNNKRDLGFLWSHHVLQLPCHQSISDEQFEYITTVFKNAVALSLDTLIK